MKEEEIQLGTEFVSYTDILEGKTLSNPYFNRAIAFCRSWLKGNQHFEIHSSGSTGTPKLIQLSREQMQLSAEATAARLGLKKDERALVCINIDYIGGLMMLVRGMHLGLKLHVIEVDSDPLSHLEETELPDFVAMVPLQLENSLLNQRRKLESIQNTIIGGASIPDALLIKCRGLKSKVYHTYGMTETCSHFAMKLISTGNADSHFYCLAGYEVRLDERDCLAVRGPVTGMQWLHSNDIAEIAADGGFDLKGRIDNVINSGALKLPAEQLEARLAEKISGSAFFFAGLPDERLGEKLVLLVEGDKEKEPEFLQAMEDFGRYEKPKEIYFLERFTYTETGKLDRKASLGKLKKNHS